MSEALTPDDLRMITRWARTANDISPDERRKDAQYAVQQAMIDLLEVLSSD